MHSFRDIMDNLWNTNFWITEPIFIFAEDVIKLCNYLIHFRTIIEVIYRSIQSTVQHGHNCHVIIVWYQLMEFVYLPMTSDIDTRWNAQRFQKLMYVHYLQTVSWRFLLNHRNKCSLRSLCIKFSTVHSTMCDSRTHLYYTRSNSQIFKLHPLRIPKSARQCMIKRYLMD